MLSVHGVGVGDHRYYLATVAAGKEPGTRLVEPDGVWLGAAAAGLGLVGRTVVPGDLDAVLQGIDPLSGEILDPRHRRVELAAFDCTLAPPKSISVLHGLAPPEVVDEVRRAHESSVAATVGYLEREAARVRRQSERGREVLKVSGLAAAAFVHRSSRADDPHLHTHVLVANLAADPTGHWSALDGRGLFQHAQAASALYAAQLRHELGQRLALRVDRSSASGDLLGVDRRVVLAFSRRSAAIAAELEQSGRRSPAAWRRAAARTRPPKDLSISYEELVESWRRRALELGIPPRRLQSLLDWRLPERSTISSPASRTGPASPPGPVSTPGQGSGEPERVEERLAALPLGSLTRRDLVVHVCRSLPGGAPVERVENLVESLVRRPELETRSGLPRRFYGRAQRLLPAGPAEAHFVSEPTRRLEQRWQAALGSSGSLGGPLGLRGTRPTGTGARQPASALVALEELAALRADHADRGHRLAALVVGRARADAFEHLTGIESVVAGSRLPLLAGATLLVGNDLARSHPELALAVLDRAETGARVLALDVLESGNRPPGGALRAPDAAPGVSAPDVAADVQAAGVISRCSLGASEVVVAAGPVILLEAVLEDYRRNAAEAPTAIVVPDRRTAALVSSLEGGKRARVVPGHDRRAIAAAERLLVIGAVRSLRDRADGALTRYCVLPDAMRAGERRARLLELAPPAALLEAIGAPCGDPEERARWRQRALLATRADVDRDLAADRLPPGPADGRAVDRRFPAGGGGLWR